MKLCYLTIGTLLAALAMNAQTTDPLSSDARQAYERIKTNIMKAADKMPDDGYAFKATPDVRPYGQLIAHIADSQTRGCSSVTGEAKQSKAGSLTAKADLVTALKDSFALCDAAYNSLTDATATQMVKTYRGDRAKISALYGNTIHLNEMYGTMSVYLRLKNIVPPSSEK